MRSGDKLSVLCAVVETRCLVSSDNGETLASLTRLPFPTTANRTRGDLWRKNGRDTMKVKMEQGQKMRKLLFWLKLSFAWGFDRVSRT